ncbi:MAG TPA: hypothetical protein VFO93_02245 [Hymenobacter sp.]|nr:hypothetical protein [Hymenobacter sp.]HET9502333.1 hypothetical protein [Hymenobacter sp.]
MGGKFFDKKGLILAEKARWAGAKPLSPGRLLGRPAPARRLATGGRTAR